MKKFLVSTVAVCLVLMVSSQVQAQQGKYVNSAAGRVGNLVDKANNEGYKLQVDGFSCGGGWLKQGANNWVPIFTMNLNPNKEYRFIAAGDLDARDVDLQILDSNGNIVASDTAVSPEAIVNFRPNAAGKYTIRVRLYASRDNVQSMCMAIVLTK